MSTLIVSLQSTKVYIQDFYKKIENKKRKRISIDDSILSKIEYNTKLQNCIICDIDGTLADSVDRKTFDFDKTAFVSFLEKCLEVIKTFSKYAIEKLILLKRRGLSQIQTAFAIEAN